MLGKTVKVTYGPHKGAVAQISKVNANSYELSNGAIVLTKWVAVQNEGESHGIV